MSRAQYATQSRTQHINQANLGVSGLVVENQNIAAWHFGPKALTPALWLRSDLGVTLNGSNVSAWGDQSSNNRHAVQGTGANQPAYSASGGLLGRPIITSAASKGFIAGVAADWTFLHDGTGCTIVLISFSRATPNNYLLGTQSSSGANRGINFFWSGTTHAFTVGDGALQQLSINRAASALVLNKTIAMFATASTPDASITVNGVAGTTASAASPSVVASPNALGVGWGGSSAFGTDTDFYELICFARSLNATELVQLNNYLTSRYG